MGTADLVHDRRPGLWSPPWRVQFLAAARRSCTRPFTWGEHGHANHELITAREGTYRCRLNGQELALAPSAVLLIKPGDRHEDPLAVPVMYDAIWLEPVLPGGRRVEILAPGCRPQDQLVGSGTARLQVLGEQLLTDAGEDGAWPGPLLDALAGELFWRLLRLLPHRALAPHLRERDEGMAEALRALFTDVLDRPPAVAALAKRLGLGRDALAARCQRAFGLPPAKALARARLERAAELLAAGAPVASTATRLDFASVSHFSRAIRHCYGLPPSQVARNGQAAVEEPGHER